MINPIDENQIVKDLSTIGVQRIRPLNSIEKEIVSKVNELIVRFNEVFPL